MEEEGKGRGKLPLSPSEESGFTSGYYLVKVKNLFYFYFDGTHNKTTCTIVFHLYDSLIPVTIQKYLFLSLLLPH